MNSSAVNSNLANELLTVTRVTMTYFTQECASYYPSQTAIKCKYGPFEVELVDTVTTENADVTVREFKFSKSNRVSCDPIA